MKQTYNEIVSILSSDVGRRLNMDADQISYSTQEDPGAPVPGYAVSGRWESIDIPDAYMTKAGAHSADDFLNWLKKQC